MFSISASSSARRRRWSRTIAGIVVQAGELRGAPAALAGDQLVAAAGRAGARASAAGRRARRASRPARRAPRSSKPCAAGAGSAGSARPGPGAVLGARRLVGTGRIAARPRPIPRLRSATLRRPPWPARSRRPTPRSADRGGSRQPSSAPRRSARCAGSRCRRPASGSARGPRPRRPAPARAPVVHRQQHPGDLSRGFSSRWISASVSSSRASPSSAKYSVCTGHDHPVGRDERVDRQRAERRRAVEDRDS